MNIKKCASSLLALLMALISISTSGHATISCAGTLPERYFERIDATTSSFAGKLIDTDNNTQQLQGDAGQVIISGLSDAHILMNKYVLAKKDGKHGVINAAGTVIVPFEYDNI